MQDIRRKQLENLYNLPYSVDEIYGLHESGKYHDTRKAYQQMYHIYSIEEKFPIKSEKIIVEDSNSGLLVKVFSDETNTNKGRWIKVAQSSDLCYTFA